MTKWYIFSQVLIRYILYGVFCGALVGAITGIFAEPRNLLGLIIGPFLGVAVAVPVGLLTGLLNAGITITWFVPLRSPRNYRICLTITTIVAIVALVRLFISGPADVLVVTALIGAALSATIATQVIVGWYIDA
jgi:hypothetical protein